MKKQTFLALCGFRDTQIMAREVEADMDDLLRLECIAGLMGCLEVELGMYVARQRDFPAQSDLVPEGWQQQMDANGTTRIWCSKFLHDAPTERAKLRVAHLLALVL